MMIKIIIGCFNIRRHALQSCSVSCVSYPIMLPDLSCHRPIQDSNGLMTCRCGNTPSGVSEELHVRATSAGDTW